jgi:molybdate transport system ATP-binding protein
MTTADVSLSARVRIARRQPGPGSFVLDVAFDAPPGITVLVGPSGCGKSTTLAAIAGTLAAGSGRVALGDDVWFDSDAGIDIAPHRRRVSLVFQSLALFPHMTALENVAYGVPRTLPARERGVRAEAMLARMDAAHLLRRRPATFSGGEAQRVALARAFAHEPRVLLLDEPLTALDVPLRARLVQDVRRFVDELEIPAIYVTHDVGEAMTVADHAVVMSAGGIVAAGDPLHVLPHSGAD